MVFIRVARTLKRKWDEIPRRGTIPNDETHPLKRRDMYLVREAFAGTCQALLPCRLSTRTADVTNRSKASC